MPQPEKKCGCQQSFANQSGAFGLHDAREQELSGIRCTDAARLLGAVERQRIGAELGAPEGRFEALGEALGLGFEPVVRRPRRPMPARAARDRRFCGKDVTLDFGQRDVAFGQPAVGVEDRIVGILPSLVGQALFAGAAIFDKAVAIGVAQPVDPAERRLDGRPQLRQGFLVAGALGIEAGKQHEQRRRVDAAVVLAKRHLVQRRHFPGAHLVQDLARLCIGKRIGLFRLIRGKAAQHAARDARDRTTASAGP